ncbi:MAG: response regulator [Bdellovibrionota bacterium]
MNNNASKGKTILVVDDDNTLRDAIVFDFKRRGFHVLSAPNGTEAFTIVKNERVDAVVTDVRMPNGTGIELLDNIKTFNLHTPVVIFITGFTDLALEDAYDKGASVVLSKPFDRKALIANVERVLMGLTERLSIEPKAAADTLKIDLAFSNRGDAVQAKALRFGQGGMCLHTQERLIGINQPVSFKIEAPGHQIPLLSGHGIVRWVREVAEGPSQRNLGIEFMFLEESCRKNVVELLQSLSIKAFIPKST